MRLLTEAGLRQDGLTVGIGPTRTLAWLAALRAVRQGSAAVVLPGEEWAFLAALPLTVLQQVPDAAAVASLSEMVAALEETGIRTLGHLQRLSADALARRFGADGRALATLVDGRDLRPLRPRVAEPWLGARVVFEPPLMSQHLAVALGVLAEQLALTLAQKEQAAGKLRLVLESETGVRLEMERRLARPLGTTRALLAAAEGLLAGLLADATPTLSDATPEMLADVAPDVALPGEGERYVTLRLRLGGLHPATVEQQRLWAKEQRQTGSERVERLETALQALSGGKHADALLRAELHEPAAVLSEERYRLAPRITPRSL